MGAVISKATDGIGDLLEKTLLAPFKTMFDGSCQECSGPWDMYSSWGSSNALEKASVRCVGLHLSNTKRVNRRRRRHLRHRQFQDIEEGYSSSGYNDLWDDYHNLNVSRKRKSLSRRRRDRVQRSVHLSSRHGSRSHHHRHVRLKTRSMYVHVMGTSQRLKSSRHVKIGKVTSVRRKTRTSKRRRLSPLVFFEQFQHAAASVLPVSDESRLELFGTEA
ncbi:hypothetical protein ACLB2K_055032 [Fragaria x ananassa]